MPDTAKDYFGVTAKDYSEDSEQRAFACMRTYMARFTYGWPARAS